MAAAGFALDKFYMTLLVFGEAEDASAGEFLVPVCELGLAQRTLR